MNLRELNKRKRIISRKECEYDMKETLHLMFEAYYHAVRLYNDEIRKTPIEDRTRGMEASYFNSKMIQCMRFRLGDYVKRGKYGRRMLVKDGYIILFKKLNNKNMPMNVRTCFSDSIENQLQGTLFEGDNDGTLPILFFGYKKDRFGQLHNPRVVYIDEGDVKWVIDENCLSLQTPRHSLDIVQPTSRVSVKPMAAIKRKAE